MGRGQDGVSTLKGDCLRFSLDMSSGLQRVAPHRGVYEETPHMQLPNPPPIYLDYHATTPVDPRVAAVMTLDKHLCNFPDEISMALIYWL